MQCPLDDPSYYSPLPLDTTLGMISYYGLRMIFKAPKQRLAVSASLDNHLAVLYLRENSEMKDQH